MSAPRKGGDARRRLAAPTLAMLPRVADSLSFLYLDMVRIIQDDTGVCAQIQAGNNRTDLVYIPTAALSCLLLGPGVSITTPALTTLARHGTSVVCVGAGGVRAYAGILPDSLTTHWLEQQAAAWTDPAQRLDVAIRMYQKRFAETDMPDITSLEQLRGMEGHRMKAFYKILAQQHGIGRFRRNYHPDQWHAQDPVNLALSAANTASTASCTPLSSPSDSHPPWASPSTNQTTPNRKPADASGKTSASCASSHASFRTSRHS